MGRRRQPWLHRQLRHEAQARSGRVPRRLVRAPRARAPAHRRLHPLGRSPDPVTPSYWETSPMNLTHDAMLVSLRITAWSGRLYDRQASNHVAAQHDASASAGRYNKRLLPKGRLRRAHRDRERSPRSALCQLASLGRPGLAAAHRRQLRSLHRADGRLARAHGARARPLHRGLRRQHRPGTARPGKTLPHRGLPLQGGAAGQVRDPLPHRSGAGCGPLHGEAREPRHGAGQARHRARDRGAPARRRGRSLPAPRRSGGTRFRAPHRGRRG